MRCITSRSQQSSTFTQSQGESKDSFQQAQDALGKQQGAIGSYQTQLGRYAAQNPYAPGGEYQANEGMISANTADALARREGAKLQTLSARTGQNPAAAIGATEAMSDQAQRDLTATQAQQEQQRISGEADYNRGVVAGYGTVPGMEEGVASGNSRLYGTSLGVQEDAAKTPSFMDTLGSSFAENLGKGVAGLATGGGFAG